MADAELLDTPYILIIDDDDELAEMYRMGLEANHYSVERARNGRLGLERARASQPDLILLDVRMPEMDGLEVLRALRGDPATSKIPVVMLTNYTDEAIRQEGERLGILGWRSKTDTTPGSLSSWVEGWSSAWVEETGS